MKCPNCKAEVKDGAKFCTKCGAKLQAATPESQPTEPTNAQPAAAQPDHVEGLELTTNNLLSWDIPEGQVARVVTGAEIAIYKHCKGVIIPEGTTAFVRSNGKTIATLDGGEYRFAEAKKKEEKEPNTLQRGWMFVQQLFEHKKTTEQKEEEEKAILDHLKKQSEFSIIIMINKAFPLLIGAKQATYDDYKTFRPMVIHTRDLALNVGVNAYFKIADKEAFMRHFTIDKHVINTTHIVHELSDIIRVQLEEAMRNIGWDGSKIPDEVRRQMKDVLNQGHDNWFGLEMARLVEITAGNEDLERFERLSTEMYLSEQELDYLQRSNDLKNRLAAVQNAQALTEAQDKVDFDRKMDAINRDNLLREDEMAQFKLMLETQQRIREAKSKEEEQQVLDEIRKQGLLREVDLRRIAHDAMLEERRKEADFEYEQQRRQEQLREEKQQHNFDRFMAMEQAANQHELEMARLHADTDKEWNEKLREQQQKQNDQMMQMLQIMAGNMNGNTKKD